MSAYEVAECLYCKGTFYSGIGFVEKNICEDCIEGIHEKIISEIDD